MIYYHFVFISKYVVNILSRPLERKCLVQCRAGDNICFEDCSEDYTESLKKCPCQEHCPGGCPCPEYECPSTRPWILVLRKNRSPLIMDGSGQYSGVPKIRTRFCAKNSDIGQNLADKNAKKRQKRQKTPKIRTFIKKSRDNKMSEFLAHHCILIKLPT